MAEAVLFGSYELLDRIGEGGMAEVWRARSRGVAGFEKTVVIKRVLPSLMAKKTFAELLVREAKIAALLSHPNIVQIFDLGEEQGAYFIAMEYVHGKDLGAAMAFKPRIGRPVDGLSLPLKLWIVIQACKALDFAHRRKGGDGRPLNIVHRDVSPQNVLLGYEGAVKVADFGIARADEHGLGRGEDPKVLRGKYAYMSPEQARGEPLDRRSDIFALGIVLYELVVGKRLFRAQTTKETLMRVRDGDVPRVDDKALSIPASLPKIIHKALAHDRDDRYPTAQAMLSEINEVLAEMGAFVDEPDLAEAMERMFPPDDGASPNKLRVDLMMRAYDDASLVGTPPSRTDITPMAPPSGTAEHTMAFPASRRIRSETSEVVMLAARERIEDGAIFDAVTTTLGGYSLPPVDGLREAIFGHQLGLERGALHAARAALEFRRRLIVEGPTRIEPVPSMCILRGDATVFEVSTVEPHEALHHHALVTVAHNAAGEIRVQPELRELVGRTFVVSDGEQPVLEGYRGREDRDALAIRERGPLSGRRSEVRALSEAVIRASGGGRGGAFFIVGEPGSGRSRLVAELGALAASQDVAVVRGRGDETQGDGSYGALAEVFRDLCGVELGDIPSERFAKVDRLRVLGLTQREVRLVGELLGLAYPVARDERAGRPRGLELTLAARKALRALSADRAVVLALEDVHWMDDATRQMLPMLVRGLERARVVAVMTARPGTPIPSDVVEVMTLKPLDMRSAGRLFAYRVGARAVEEDLLLRVTGETAGNPGWVEAMATALSDDDAVEVIDGVARLMSGRPTPITPHGRSMISGWIGELRPVDRAVVRAAAVFEHGADLTTLRAVAGLKQDVAEGAVRRLLVERLLVPATDELADGVPRSWWPGAGAWGGGRESSALPSIVRVPGSLPRRAIMDGMGDTELRRLHGSVAAVLERQGAASDDERIAMLAHHAARSADRRRASDYLMQAAEAAERAGEHGLAAERLGEAARIIRESGDDPKGELAVELALRAADLALVAGDVEVAGAVLDDAQHVVAARTVPATRVRIALTRARVAARRELWGEAASTLEHVAETIETLEDTALRGRAFLELGRVELEAGRPDVAANILTRAVNDLEEIAPELAGVGWCRMAIARARAGQFEQADEAVSSALALTARLGSGPLRHRSLAAMAAVQDARGMASNAASRFRESAEVAEQEGDEADAARASVFGAVAAVEADRLADAAVMAETAVRLGKRCSLETVVLVGAAVQAVLALTELPDTTYVGSIVRTIDRLEELGRWGAAALALMMLARAHVVLGDLGAAARTLSRAASLAGRAGHAPLERRLEERAKALGE